MASTPSQLGNSPAPGEIADTQSHATGNLLIALAPLGQEAFETTLAHLSEAFVGGTVLVSTPDLPTGASG